MRHLHLGLGRFHRAHQAFYLHRKGLPITAFSMRSPTEADALRQAGHRYELVVVEKEGESRITISAIDEALFMGTHKSRYLELMASPQVETMTLTVTEKGYCAKPDGSLDRPRAEGNDSVLSLLVEGFRARQGACSKPLAVMSCDNLSANGRMLERLCLEWSEVSGLPFDCGLVTFPNSMVDRIVPAGPDPLEVRTEAFHQWVIEDRFLNGRPDWEQDGLVFAPEVEPFERMKLCLLNASHSFLAYYGQLRGHEFVHQAVGDPHVRGLLEKLCLEEVGPHLTVPRPYTLEGYVQAMLERFDNPGLPHKLSQIAMDGSQKVPVRFLPFWDKSEVIRLGLSAWFTYYWMALSGEGDYLVSDPYKDRLAQLAGQDFQQTAQLWSELLGWPQLAVEKVPSR